MLVIENADASPRHITIRVELVLLRSLGITRMRRAASSANRHNTKDGVEREENVGVPQEVLNNRCDR